MKKGISLILFIMLLSVLETKVRLWSGNSPDLLLSGLVGLSGVISILELILLALLGFFFLAGPILSTELVLIVVIIAFVHFLRLFVLGQSLFLPIPLMIVAIMGFYLATSGLAILAAPLFLIEICLVSIGMNCLVYALTMLIEAMS